MKKYLINNNRPNYLWISSFVIAVLLNFCLFSFLSMLSNRIPEQRKNFDIPRPLSLVRMKQPETQARKKTAKKEVEPEKLKKPVVLKNKYLKKILKLNLPFKINQSLPGLQPEQYLPKMAGFSIQNSNNIYGADEIDRPVIPVRQIPPIYPIQAKRRGIEGWVKIKILINEKGTFENVEILDADPKGYFEKSVTRCVSSWKFTPGTIQGEPVKTWVLTTIRFVMKN